MKYLTNSVFPMIFITLLRLYPKKSKLTSPSTFSLVRTFNCGNPNCRLIEPNKTYEQVRYTYAMELQNSSSTKYMLRDADGKLDDAWLNAVKRIGRNIGKTPRNNQAQNEQTKAAAKKYNLSKEGQRLLHDNVSKNGYGYQEILEEAKAIAEMGGKYVK